MSTDIQTRAIANPLPQQVVAVSDELLARVNEMTAKASGMTVIDVDTLEAAESLFADIDDLAKEIHRQRMEITRPIDGFKKAVIAAEESAVEPLHEARKTLGQAATSYRRKLEAERREAERKAREEAERQAREERERREAERQAAIDAARAEAELFGGDPDLDEVPPPPPAVPEFDRQMIPAAALPPEPKTKARVGTAKRKVLNIVDSAALMAAACADEDGSPPGTIAGAAVLVIDEKAVKRLLDAGVPVPGAQIDIVESIRRAR